ncbi:MAG: sodium:proton antiporter [Candidatus Neomarinimicrobiota bacterium]
MYYDKIKYLILILIPSLVLAAGDGHSSVPHLNGENLGIFWVLPFVGILLSIAVFPLVAEKFWHHNFGKISLFWALLLIIPFTFTQGIQITVYELLHVGLLEYVPFIILLLSLFTISGGVQLKGSLVGTPLLNTIIIFIGTVLASWMGTTGAAMLLIRPLIRANQNRKKKVHIIVFFIFLVANIGGSLTPLGDPPLFLGFLKGVDFFWTTSAMFFPMLFMVACLLIIFFGIDIYFYNKEDIIQNVEQENEKLGLEGSFNLLLLGGVLGGVLLSGFWKPHIHINVYHVHVELQNIVRDVLLLSLTYISWTITHKTIRVANEYTWFPIVEVGKLFAGIFVTIIPAIAILKAGTNGALSSIVSSVSNESGEPINYMYFWLTGILSSFLDNAPTYLVFFNTAGGNPSVLMGDMYQTLLAISAGAVFMGANSYIGNAPNFMVKSIAESSNIEMPSFFGYIIKWSLPILVPLFVIVTWVFF